MGVTPLMIAILKGNLRMVKILLDEGCSLSITTATGLVLSTSRLRGAS